MFDTTGAILLREVTKFRDDGPESQWRWSSIIAGDFNFGPDDPAYTLLMGDALLPEQKKRQDSSYVVHATIDSTVATDGAAQAEEEEEGAEAGENDPDRVIVNARPAQPSDDLQSGTVISAYDAGQRQVPGISESGLTFGSRVSVPQERRVLDYIFVLDARGRDVPVVRLAKPHRKEVFGDGLPKKGVCVSDHISLAAEQHWLPP
ncbi:hypothetical protein ONZ51_g11521 [Trametes cubensis]|uniref:Endonuclease/exonuclease/phosphatase domain-containing protein n=1 Tax=Trametes cubensis TaxID=1111947 RepID=A0AAD7THH3_9APHY|nr:hypothetical protein ONZ51_g11521 [Trametes cubensis]